MTKCDMTHCCASAVVRLSWGISRQQSTILCMPHGRKFASDLSRFPHHELIIEDLAEAATA